MKKQKIVIPMSKPGSDPLQNIASQATERKTMADRFFVSRLGEPYYDILKVEAWLKGRTMAAEGNSILCARLMQREEYRTRLLELCARKRGITVEELWDRIVADLEQPYEAKDYKQWADSLGKDAESPLEP
jgi:hypothetical protein